jgi:hypothetical protein
LRVGPLAEFSGGAQALSGKEAEFMRQEERKRYVVSLFSGVLLAALFLWGAVAQAHPPKNITVAYDAGTATLIVTIEHSVKDVEKHYIDEIRILKGGAELAQGKPSRQTDTEQEIFTVNLPGLKSGDILTVDAKCNIFGTLRKDVPIP